MTLSVPPFFYQSVSPSATCEQHNRTYLIKICDLILIFMLEDDTAQLQVQCQSAFLSLVAGNRQQWFVSEMKALSLNHTVNTQAGKPEHSARSCRDLQCWRDISHWVQHCEHPFHITFDLMFIKKLIA